MNSTYERVVEDIERSLTSTNSYWRQVILKRAVEDDNQWNSYNVTLRDACYCNPSTCEHQNMEVNIKTKVIMLAVNRHGNQVPNFPNRD